jgi:hypothetical protein
MFTTLNKDDVRPFPKHSHGHLLISNLISTQRGNASLQIVTPTPTSSGHNRLTGLLTVLATSSRGVPSLLAQALISMCVLLTY